MIVLENSDCFTLFSNRSDYITFVENKRNSFDCPEDWETFFGFELPIDDDGNELETVLDYSEHNKFLTEPQAYPCIAYCTIEKNKDRFGEIKTRIYDYAVVGIKEEKR